MVILFLAAFLCSCRKEKHQKWEVTDRLFFPNTGLTSQHINDFSEQVPYDTISSSEYVVYIEDHTCSAWLTGNFKYIKQFVLEVPDTINSFYFEDEDVYDSLDCFVYHFYGANEDGYYRIHQGFISGSKTGGYWDIDFNVYYGGTNHSEYRMVKDAKYD